MSTLIPISSYSIQTKRIFVHVNVSKRKQKHARLIDRHEKWNFAVEIA